MEIMNTLVNQLTAGSKITKSKNGWYYLIVPCEGFTGGIHVATRRSEHACVARFNELKATFPHKEY